MEPVAAVLSGVPNGIGGLGVHSLAVITALARGETEIHALGLSCQNGFFSTDAFRVVVGHASPRLLPSWVLRYSWWRRYPGNYQFKRDCRLGYWAQKEVAQLQPSRCYVFTQVGLEVLSWARKNNIPAALDNPNGHIRHYKAVLERESRRWLKTSYRGHPTEAMIERIEEEYELADRIRVSSDWAKESLVAYGVPEKKISIIPQPLDLKRFQPCAPRKQRGGPLRVCYVGNLNLAKGVHYLLRAIRRVGPQKVSLEIVGSTGNRPTRKFFEEERKGVNVQSAPGDPVPAYHRAEVFVLPSLHDGFGFVVAEAMACGLPVIVTEDCGSASWIKDRKTGWVVPSANEEALADALSDAMRHRDELQDMGSLARSDVERLADPSCLKQLRDWVFQPEYFVGDHLHNNS